MLQTEIDAALKPLTDTGRVSIAGIAAYDLILLVDNEELWVKIPATATQETLLETLTTNYLALAAILD